MRPEAENVYNARQAAAERYRHGGDRAALVELVDGSDGVFGFYPLTDGEIRPGDKELVVERAIQRTAWWVEWQQEIVNSTPGEVKLAVERVKLEHPTMLLYLVDTTHLVKRAVAGLNAALAGDDLTAISWGHVLLLIADTEEYVKYVLDAGSEACYNLLRLALRHVNKQTIPDLTLRELFLGSFNAIPGENWWFWLRQITEHGAMDAVVQERLSQFAGKNPMLFAVFMGHVDSDILWCAAIDHWTVAIKEDALEVLIRAVDQDDIRRLDKNLLSQALAHGTSRVRLALNQRIGEWVAKNTQCGGAIGR